MNTRKKKYRKVYACMHGPLLTFCAAILSWKFNLDKKVVACIYPVLVNAFGVSAYVSSFYGVPYLMSVATVAVGEFIAAVFVGYPLLMAIERTLFGLKVKEKSED